MNIKKAAALVSLIGGMAGGADAAPLRFEKLIVLGDSLSDNGNAGRFSNGPVWVEHLAVRFGLDLVPARVGGTNFAVGGAQAAGNGPFDLDAQTRLFLSNSPAEADALYVIYAGGNDLRAGRDPAIAARAVVGATDRIAAAGGKYFLVPNMGDLGVTPDYRARGAELRGREQAVAFNAALDAGLSELLDRHDLRLYRLDVFALSRSVEAGFVDGIHPDTASHAKLAEAAYKILIR